MNRRIVFRNARSRNVSLWLTSVSLMLMLPTSHAVSQAPTTLLAIGSPAPDFALPGVDGQIHKLSDYGGSKVLAIVFLCNHCTASQLYEERIEKLATDYREKGVTVLGIQSEHPESVRIEDLAFSDVGDSLEDMKARATYRRFSFPYLYDGETQKVARQFGVSVTPQVFLFDQTRKLQYEGRIDDNLKDSSVKTRDVHDAIEELLAGKPIVTPVTVAFGDALHAIGTTGAAQAAKVKLDAEPVKIALVNTAELAKLRSNGTGKLLLVNFFATWCGPCVSEFPDLVATYRMYRGRNFSLTTVSSNEPDEQPDVLKFLQKMHASSTNLLFGTTDTYTLQAAFDPNMGAAVPFTVLMAPNGDILFQQQGDLDMMALRRAILANLPDDAAHAGSQAYWAREEQNQKNQKPGQ